MFSAGTKSYVIPITAKSLQILFPMYLVRSCLSSSRSTKQAVVNCGFFCCCFSLGHCVAFSLQGLKIDRLII